MKEFPDYHRFSPDQMPRPPLRPMPGPCPADFRPADWIDEDGENSPQTRPERATKEMVAVGSIRGGVRRTATVFGVNDLDYIKSIPALRGKCPEQFAADLAREQAARVRSTQSCPECEGPVDERGRCVQQCTKRGEL
jgi:hypothetical protein